MGLIDVLNGMQHGPRGQTNPAAQGEGMSPITMAILGLLAYKAIKGFGGSHPAGSAPAPTTPSPGTSNAGASGGSLADILRNGLGGLFAGGAAGGALSGGLGDLLKQFQQRSFGSVADSWIGSGQNEAISPDKLAAVLGPDMINSLSAHTGLSREELLQALSQHLPNAIDKLTPHGRLPTAEEANHLL